MPLSILIPILNEPEGVKAILAQLAEGQVPPGSEIVFLSGCQDAATRELVLRSRDLHDKFKISWLEVEEKGIAAAWNLGLRAATGSILVTMDGDGAHHLSDVAILVKRIEAGADLVIASRHGAGHGYMPGRNVRDRVASLAAGWTFARKHRLKVTDPLHGFRARRRKLAESSADFLQRIAGNVWMGEETRFAVMRGYHVAEVPIAYRARLAGRENKRLMAELAPFLRSLVRN